MRRSTLGFLAAALLAGRAAAQEARVFLKPRPPVLDPANVDPDVKPCEDFYAWANGGWLKRNPVPADKARWGTFEELADRNREVLRRLAERAAADPTTKDPIERLVGDFWRAGMDEAAIEKAGLAPLAPWLREIRSVRGRADLPKVLASLQRIRAGAGFGFTVAPDAKASTKTIGILSQGGLGLPERDYYLKDDAKSKEIREKYVAHVARMLELAGDSAAGAAAGAAAVMDLETKLATASMTRVEQRDPQKTYNRRTIAALAKEAPGFDFAAYLRHLGVAGAGPRTALNVRQPAFFTAFAARTKDVPAASWRTYLKWHLLRSAAPALPKAFDEESFAFFGRTLQGTEKQEERWRRVLAATDQSIGEALGGLYVRSVFPPRAKTRMAALVENLRAALKEKIEALPWMEPETKAQALRKLAAFGVKIGYPDRWRSYRALRVDRVSYLGNVLRARGFETRRILAKLGRPVDRAEWTMTPPTVNAYYTPTMNEIVFPAGILQPPFFDDEADDAVNYGAIGAVIGHEMTHGFDDSGSQYDADGNLKNWWKEGDRKEYEARTALVVKQFDGYKALPDQAVNGKLTLGENIADLGGLKIAWAALQKALAAAGTDPKGSIDGLTHGQRFFLSYATVWRNNIREDALRVRLNTDPHSPGRYRVLGPLSNLPEFREAFPCDDSNAMVRPAAERPSIW